MGKIYLIRHGETDSNKGHRFQGRINMPLNAKGLEQSEKLAAYMQHLPVDKGLEYAEISRRWPKEMDDFLTRPGEWIPPQGESFHDVARRCQAAFDYIFEREGHEKNIAIVSHGGIIRVQLCLLLGIPLNNLWKLSVHNVSVSMLNDWQGNIIAETINDAHFAREQGKSVNWLHK